MIFAAGLGTRFKPWTDEHPKALAMIHNKSLLQRNIEYLQLYGITDVVVNVHHFADQIIEAVEKTKGWGSNIIISDERDEVLETGGGLLKAKDFLKTEDAFITLNADVLTNLSIHKLLSFHKQNNALISLGISNRISSRSFLFNANNRLCGWENNVTGEKKIVFNHSPLHAMAYTCVAVFEPQVFDYITQSGKFSLTDTYLKLAPHHLIQGMDHSGDLFIDVGKPESVAIAEKMFV
jgi:NDP-sugar pyrophosphorylase family protein